jgi:hypothetical protein
MDPHRAQAIVKLMDIIRGATRALINAALLQVQ